VRPHRRQPTLSRCAGISPRRNAAFERDGAISVSAACKSVFQYSGGKSSFGPTAGGAGGLLSRAAAILSICFGVGIRQLAGRSVMAGGMYYFAYPRKFKGLAPTFSTAFFSSVGRQMAACPRRIP